LLTSCKRRPDVRVQGMPTAGVPVVIDLSSKTGSRLNRQSASHSRQPLCIPNNHMKLHRGIWPPKSRRLAAVLISSVLSLGPTSAQAQHKPPSARSKDEWSVRRAKTLENLQQVMGKLPEQSSAPLDLSVLEEERIGGIRRQKITFVSEVLAGNPDRVSAYLLFPDGSNATRKKTAAVLCLHQTTSIGKGEPAGLGGKPGLQYALELAQRGYVTLAPDYPNFGGYEFDPYANGYASATMKGIVNHRRALDLLQSLTEVDPERVGVIGHSLGGHNALFLAAFDERVKAIVTSCGFTSFAKYMKGDLTGWSHKGYMPRIADRYGKDPKQMPFDFSDILASLAPRAVFINAPLRDDNFEVSGVRDCVKAALPAYDAVFRSKKELRAVYPNSAHEFPAEVRRAAYRFLARALK
jgi:pimeloyl-ACP methyl ester carboxylesterase